ncbi:hypothetical protein F53441_5847 [Fusarium austroafricanum]|uniref:Uncharacterized protein n=1 Tax=Fusarium austroafricanum TaxID=2364996 RepID=A0A8H4KK16_9HYPO|nr:hypothetical protein F53441_5847 [Fusarium austroafricanum]
MKAPWISSANKASAHSSLVQLQPVSTFEPDRSHEPSFWPNHPKPIEYGWKAVTIHILWLLPLIMIWVPFVVLAISIQQLNGQPISDHGDAVREAISISATLWPIALAAVLGSLFRALALFKAEKGTNLGTLAILLGSQTLVNTVKTAFNLRIFSFWTLLLIALWTFSLLGGQAVLRTIRIAPHTSVQDYDILYSPAADIGLPFNYGLWESASGRAYQLSKIFPMFGAALSAPNALAQASNGSSPNFNKVIEQLGGAGIASADARADLWGNVRVPEITSLPGYKSDDPHKWVEVPSDELVTYESLIGIPIRGTPSRVAGNLTFQLSAAYVALECSPWFNTTEWLSKIPNGLQMHTSMNSSIIEEPALGSGRGGVSHIYMDIPRRHRRLAGVPSSGPVNPLYIPGEFNFSASDRYSKGPVEYGTLVFGTRNNSTICDVSHVYVDADIKCERSNKYDSLVCQSHKVRRSPGYKIPYPDTQIIADNWGTAPGVIIAGLPWLASSYHPGNKSPMENYLADPTQGIEDDNTSDYGITIEYTRLPRKVFAQRLAIVINTAMRVSYYAPAVLGFSKTNLTAMTSMYGSGTRGLKYGSTTGNFTTSEERYQVQKDWMAVFSLSLAIMGLCVLITILISLGTKAPDFFNSISALTRDSVHIKVPAGGSTFNGDERARVLKNRRLRIRDVQFEDEVGYIALADDNGHEGKQDLKVRGRVFG